MLYFLVIIESGKSEFTFIREISFRRFKGQDNNVDRIGSPRSFVTEKHLCLSLETKLMLRKRTKTMIVFFSISIVQTKQCHKNMKNWEPTKTSQPEDLIPVLNMTCLEKWYPLNTVINTHQLKFIKLASSRI